jgi:hypothetical protein
MRQTSRRHEQSLQRRACGQRYTRGDLMAETLMLPSHSTKDEIYAAAAADRSRNLRNGRSHSQSGQCSRDAETGFQFSLGRLLSHDGPEPIDAGPFSGPARRRLHSVRKRPFAAQPRVSAKPSSYPMSTNSLAISPAAACLNRK